MLDMYHPDPHTTILILPQTVAIPHIIPTNRLVVQVCVAPAYTAVPIRHIRWGPANSPRPRIRLAGRG